MVYIISFPLLLFFFYNQLPSLYKDHLGNNSSHDKETFTQSLSILQVTWGHSTYLYMCTAGH